MGVDYFDTYSSGSMGRKRERENPCGVCHHYHKYEEGEVCGTCGHRMPVVQDKTFLQLSDFLSEILPDFLYLGSYDNASRSELLKTLGISRVLNTVPAFQNQYKDPFTYHCPKYDQNLPFDDAIQFLEQCEKDRARVLVHCMTGKNRSPAVVIAYLMKSKGWRLGQGYQWVKVRRPSIDITQAVYQQLQEFEQKTFGSIENSRSALPNLSSSGFSFGFLKPNDPVLGPAFSTSKVANSIFASDIPPPHQFTFGSAQTNPFTLNPPNTSNNDIAMDGS